MTSEHEDKGKDKDACCGDGKTWSDAAEKAQDELDASGKVQKTEAEEMKKHAAG